MAVTDICDDDDIEVVASSALRYGRGGQQVSPRPGVIVIHRATGIAVVVEDEQSQIKNKSAAIAKLRVLLAGDPLIETVLRWADDGSVTDDVVFAAVSAYRAKVSP